MWHLLQTGYIFIGMPGLYFFVHCLWVIYCDKDKKKRVFASSAGISSGISVTGEGYVAKVERTSGGYPKLTVCADLTETAMGEIHKDQKVYMIDMDRGTFTEGEEITFSGSAQPFDHGDIFSGYNEYLYLNAEGYDCKMFPESLEKTGEHHNTAGTIAAAWNHRVKNILETILPQKERALAEAMITGDRDDIDAGIEELYTQAGVTHVFLVCICHCLRSTYLSYCGGYCINPNGKQRQ